MGEKMWLPLRLLAVRKCDCSEALAKIIQRLTDAYCIQLLVNNSPGDW